MCSYFVAETLDDLMLEVITEILERGCTINPTKGRAKELNGVLLELTNPRARLSRSGMRGKIFSCLGEMCWYLAGSNELDFISYYIPEYKHYAEGGCLFGGYGPRLFRNNGNVNQIDNIINILKNKPETRQAVIQLFDAEDIVGQHKDIPCTCSLQFILRNNKLYMITNMRSNDAYLGLPHDVFFFTMLQEIIARTLSVEIGTYKHMVGSLHLYDKNYKNASLFLEEGWQSFIPMPEMPIEDPWPSISELLRLEQEIRLNNINVLEKLDFDPYWEDVIRLLQIFCFFKNNSVEDIYPIISEMHQDIYNIFIYSKIENF